AKQIKSTIDADDLILDIAFPYDEKKPVPAAAPPRLGFATDHGAARMLGDGAFSAYLAFERLPQLMAAWGASRSASAVQTAPKKWRVDLGKAAAREARQCQDEWQKTGGALFDDYAFSGRLGQGAWEMHSAWGLSQLGSIGLPLAAADDGI